MKNSKRVSGFTLLDAMIAVVVLTTGILALTLLQATMLRSAANARERSVAMTVAQNILEARRASGLASPAGYQALASEGNCDFTVVGALVAPGTTGLTTQYRYCTQVKRYRANAGAFDEVLVSGAGAPAYGGVDSEFKQLSVSVGWRNETGAWSGMQIGDAVTGIPLSNSNELNTRPLNSASALGGPVVRYSSNYLADNVIPIAVGDTSNTQIAATNPTPTFVSGGVAQTSFQVYTYVPESSAIHVQRQIDTKALTCTCALASAAGSPAKFLDFTLRPTYWDGHRYTSPVNTPSQASYLRGQSSGDSSESAYCDICCRDHEDPTGLNYAGADGVAGTADDLVKYDRYTSHDHYLNATTPARLAGDKYNEVCRVVRVDGVYRVTQDPAIEHFAFIPTDNLTQNRTTKGASNVYGSFVRSFVRDRVLPLVGYTIPWNPQRSSLNIPGLEGSGAGSLNEQAASPISISTTETTPKRYLQNRAIMLDPLEYSARKTIENALAQTGCNTDPLPCILSYVPFASINLTPITGWKTNPADILNIEPQDQPPLYDRKGNLLSAAKYAGTVSLQNVGTSDTRDPAVADAIGYVSRTVAALVDRDVLFPIVAPVVIADWRLQDSQQFSRTGSAPAGTWFFVNLTGLAYSFTNTSAPTLGWTSGSASGGCQWDSATANQYKCSVADASYLNAITLVISNYHQTLTVGKSDGVSCPNPAGKGKAVFNQYPAKCGTFTATSPTSGVVNPTIAETSANPADDVITVDLGVVAAKSTRNVGFTLQNAGLVPGNTACNTATGTVNWDFNQCRVPPSP